MMDLDELTTDSLARIAGSGTPAELEAARVALMGKSTLR